MTTLAYSPQACHLPPQQPQGPIPKESNASVSVSGLQLEELVSYEDHSVLKARLLGTLYPSELIQSCWVFLVTYSD